MNSQIFVVWAAFLVVCGSCKLDANLFPQGQLASDILDFFNPQIMEEHMNLSDKK